MSIYGSLTGFYQVTQADEIGSLLIKRQNFTLSAVVPPTLRYPVPSSTYRATIPATQWTGVFYAAPVLAILGIFAICYQRTRYKMARRNLEIATYDKNVEVESCCSETRQAVQMIFSQTNEIKCRKPFYPLTETKEQEDCFFKQKSVETLVTNEGLTLHCGQYKLEFPPDAVSTPVHIQVSVEPSSDLELDGSKFFPIAPILRCEPSGLEFRKDFKVILQSSFSSYSKAGLAKVQTFVRQSVEHSMQYESNSFLECDGRCIFYANHFSDRQPTVDSRDVSHVRKSFCSFGYIKQVNDDKREITWYLLDKHDDSFERIQVLHCKSNEELSVPFLTFSVGTNDSLRLKLSAAEQEVSFNRSQIDIEPETVRDMSAKGYKFLLTRSPHSNPSSSIIYYAISKFEAGFLYQRAESFVTTEGDFFSIAWSTKDDSQINITCGDTVNHYYSDTSEAMSSTLSRMHRDSFEVSPENGLAMQSEPNQRQASPRPSSVDVSSPRELIERRPATRATHSPTTPGVGASFYESQIRVLFCRTMYLGSDRIRLRRRFLGQVKTKNSPKRPCCHLHQKNHPLRGKGPNVHLLQR